MIQFKLICLGVTLIATVGYAIYNHYQNAPVHQQQHSYGRGYGPGPASSRSARSDIPNSFHPPSKTSSRKRKTGKDAACSICLVDFNGDEKEKNLTCGHRFHEECISLWVQEGTGNCPNCREPI